MMFEYKKKLKKFDSNIVEHIDNINEYRFINILQI